MANLITEKQKKIVRIEYRLRLASMILVMASALGIFLLAYVVPYYVSVSKKYLLVIGQFKSVISVENKENVGESVSRIMARTNDEMKAVELYSAKAFSPSLGFNQIILHRNGSIKITGLSFLLVKPGQGQYTVTGTALTRDGLVRFVDDLKSQAGFISVESPISGFAKEANLPFSISIKSEL